MIVVPHQHGLGVVVRALHLRRAAEGARLGVLAWPQYQALAAQMAAEVAAPLVLQPFARDAAFDDYDETVGLLRTDNARYHALAVQTRNLIACDVVVDGAEGEAEAAVFCCCWYAPEPWNATLEELVVDGLAALPFSGPVPAREPRSFAGPHLTLRTRDGVAVALSRLSVLLDPAAAEPPATDTRWLRSGGRDVDDGAVLSASLEAWQQVSGPESETRWARLHLSWRAQVGARPLREVLEEAVAEVPWEEWSRVVEDDVRI